jgi:predicted extracellular nuclease
MSWKKLPCLTAISLFLIEGTASAQMRITEWMYNDAPDEFVEFTNIGVAPIDMTGWSFDDADQVPGTTSLSAFGVVSPGESVILTEDTAASFRTKWGLAASVDVIGENTNNLGRSDEINLYDAANALIDRLTYGDQDFPGTIRTVNVSGNPSTPAALGANDVSQWQFSFVGDAFGSHLSSPDGRLGNPGIYPTGVIPEPSTILLLAMAALSTRWRRLRG